MTTGTITISVDPTYPKFAALDEMSLKKVAVGIGPRGMNPGFLPYDITYPVTFQSNGDAGVNPTSWTVSYTRPITVSRQAFAVFGNITVTDYSSSRLGTLLSDFVKKGALKVTDNNTGLPLSAEDILTFTP